MMVCVFFKSEELFVVCALIPGKFLCSYLSSTFCSAGAISQESCVACPAGTIGENLGSTSIDNCVACLPGRRAELKPFSGVESQNESET